MSAEEVLRDDALIEGVVNGEVSLTDSRVVLLLAFWRMDVLDGIGLVEDALRREAESWHPEGPTLEA